MGESFSLKPPADNGSSEGGGADLKDLLIPTGTTLVAKVVKIGTETKPYNDQVTNEPVKRVSFRFVVTEPGEYTGKNVWGETSTSFVDHENCKLRSWIGEILGVADLPDGFTFNTDDLIDVPCRIVVEKYNYKDRDEVTQYRNRVTEVLRDNETAEVF